MYRKVLGLLLLAAVGVYLLAASIAAAHGWKLIALITIGLFFCLGLARHFSALRRNPLSVKATEYLYIIIAAVVGGAATWGLKEGLGIDPYVASGLVGIAGALVLPGNLAGVVYAASFVATSALSVLTGLPMVLCAGIITGGFYCLTLPILEGIGGKLGTIAAGAVLATGLIFRALGGM